MSRVGETHSLFAGSSVGKNLHCWTGMEVTSGPDRMLRCEESYRPRRKDAITIHRHSRHHLFRASCAYPRDPLGQPCSEQPPRRSRALCACKQGTGYRTHLQSHFPGTGWPCQGLQCADHHRQRSLARCAAREWNPISEMMVLPRLEPRDLSSPKVLFSWHPDGRGKTC